MDTIVLLKVLLMWRHRAGRSSSPLRRVVLPFLGALEACVTSSEVPWFT